ncbi:MAG: hypothetical protein JW702_09135 [Clostridiales bacterium]|nr:hypothetical protein [Clostridiales bacterium]
MLADNRIKVGLRLPSNLMLVVDRICRELRVSRNSLFALALSQFLASVVRYSGEDLEKTLKNLEDSFLEALAGIRKRL